MHREPTLLDRVARFFTGRTPGRAQENEAICKASSDKIDASQKELAKASRKFKESQQRFDEAVEENATLSESVFLKPKKV